MAQTIIVIGAGEVHKSEKLLASIKENYGDDCIIVTSEEANKMAINPNDRLITMPIKLIPQPLITVVGLEDYKTGRERRRERRRKERRINKGTK